jgi:agmatinase
MTNGPNLGALFGSTASSTFLGLPACPDLKNLKAAIALVGAPCASPYEAVGAYCRHAPNALRLAAAPLAANLTHYDFDSDGPLLNGVTAVDCGDLAFDEGKAAENRDAIRSAVSAVLAQGAIPVVLGGDDSIPIPVFEAFAGRGHFTILQIDAHIDWRDELMGERFGLSSTMRRASEMAQIERIVQVGARGIGSARAQDVQDARDWGVRFVTARELHRDGVAAAVDLIPEGADVIVSLDADALDPSIVPAVIGRSPGGLSYDQVVELMRGASTRGRIVGMNFVEFMPARDVDGLGALNFTRVIMTALGVLARQVERRERA